MIPRTYYPKPMLCLNCAHLGHTKLRCKTSQVCHNCGIPAHGECTAPLKCVNCKGNHNSFDKSCPFYLKEQEVIKYKIDYNVSFFEARKYIDSQLHKQSAVQQRLTIAQVVSSNPQTNVSTKPDSRDEEIANLKINLNEELLK